MDINALKILATFALLAFSSVVIIKTLLKFNMKVAVKVYGITALVVSCYLPIYFIGLACGEFIGSTSFSGGYSDIFLRYQMESFLKPLPIFQGISIISLVLAIILICAVVILAVKAVKIIYRAVKKGFISFRFKAPDVRKVKPALVYYIPNYRFVFLRFQRLLN